MTEIEKKQTLAWIKTWKAAGTVLDKEKRISILNANSKAFVESMAGMVNAVSKDISPRESSGLVEQQSYFMRVRS